MFNIFNDSSEDFLEDLFLNQSSGNPTFSLHPELTSPEVNYDTFDSEGSTVLPEKLLDLDSTKDLHPLHDNPLSGSTTFSSYPLLEELADELALITFPSKYDDDLQFDVKSDLKEIEFLLHQDKDSKVESDAENVYNDPFDSNGEKIKESKLLIDELDLPVIFFIPSIFIQEKSFEIITRVVQDKKLATSNASFVLEDFNPPFYEPFFSKKFPVQRCYSHFHLKIRRKFSNQGYTLLKKFILLLSQNYLIKVIKFSKSTRFSKAQ
nr:hypothetical protein [Tanacetum cinerariifolium]